MTGAGFRKKIRRVLGINQRNLSYVYPSNARQDFPLADDKLKTKQLMTEAGVRVPQTYQAYQYFFQLRDLEQDLAEHHEFVIKPATGRAGGGIVVMTERTADGWRTAGKQNYSVVEVRKQLADIIFGVYSFSLQDTAVVEERVCQHPEMDALAPAGLADVRVVLYRDQPVMAMSRLPTLRSDGRANLHQGAVGVGLDINAGKTVNAVLNKRLIKQHPDSQCPLLGLTLPYWDEVIALSIKAAKAMPLKYLGVDIVISQDGPILLEVNVRPGLEIQNANLMGLRMPLEAIRDILPGY